MTAIATPARRSPAATKAEGVVRTARHLYYFNGQGPWPGVTSITRVLDAPADEASLAKVRAEVRELCAKFPMYADRV